ncbi:MAG: TonB-dependent receptor plug domain-containing protein, partial [Opitutaceae bacterium]
ITAEDIRRAGHSSAAEAFRLAPGVHVAQGNTNRWDIAVRGFNNQTWSKLLVLVDGRNIYSPYYSGVDWAEANIPVDDLARIEIVRGPGGTLWGANAFNGVVNILSKPAQQTLGGLVSLRDGSSAPSDVYARYGAYLGNGTAFRIFAHAIDSENSLGAKPSGNGVDARQLRAGWRSDTVLSDRLNLTLQTDVVSIERRNDMFDNLRSIPRMPFGPIAPEQLIRQLEGVDQPTVRTTAWDGTITRGNVLARLNWDGHDGSDLAVQLYVDALSSSLDDPETSLVQWGLAENGNNADLDLTYHRRIGERHDLVVGAGTRRTHLRTEPTANLAHLRTRRNDYLSNAFIQDQFEVVPDKLTLTAGAKLEHHSTIGLQTLPNLRLTWTPSERQTIWASASRAIRAPSIAERHWSGTLALLPPTTTTPPIRIDFAANPDFAEERLDAYEAGWRFRFNPGLLVETSVYYNEYSGLRTTGMRLRYDELPAALVSEVIMTNSRSIATRGVEANATWRPRDGIEWTARVAVEDIVGTSKLNTFAGADGINAPHAISGINSWFELPADFELATALYYTTSVSGMPVDGYLRGDAQLIWHPRLDIQLSCGVQNAFGSRHLEMAGQFGTLATEVRRNFFAAVKWRF